jgi:hypothetical protein
MKYTFEQFMNLNPTLLKTVINQAGQPVDFYEDAIGGDSLPVIAVIKKHKVIFNTGFFDTDDFYIGSDYNPIYLGGITDLAYNHIVL